MLDKRDEAILAALQRSGRATFAEIGKEVGLSPSSVHERVRKLEQAGIVRGYRAEVDPEAVGLLVSALVSVMLLGVQRHDRDQGSHQQADRLGVHFGSVAANDTGLFELANPLVDAGRRQAHLFADLREGGPAAPLEGRHDGLIPLVEHADILSENRLPWPNKHRRMTKFAEVSTPALLLTRHSFDHPFKEPDAWSRTAGR